MKKIKKRNSIIFILFIITNILFIFLQIHKQSYIVKSHYEKQRLDKEKEDLMQEKNLFTQKLYELKKPTNIMNYATKKLDMQKIKLNQTKKIKINE